MTTPPPTVSPPKHSFPPLVVPAATHLLLGSLPGEESLRQQQYYAYCRNAFWPILGEIFDFDPASPYPERLEALRRNRLALWDVLAAAERRGSSDLAIRNARPNPIPELLARCPGIRRIGCNGATAHRLLLRHFPQLAGCCEIIRLPSTSPAAAGIPYAVKLAAFRDFLA